MNFVQRGTSFLTNPICVPALDALGLGLASWSTKPHRWNELPSSSGLYRYARSRSLNKFSRQRREENLAWITWFISRIIISHRQCRPRGRHRHDRSVEACKHHRQSVRTRKRNAEAIGLATRRDAEEGAGCSGARNTWRRGWFWCKRRSLPESSRRGLSRSITRSTRSRSRSKTFHIRAILIIFTCVYYQSWILGHLYVAFIAEFQQILFYLVLYIRKLMLWKWNV